MSRRTMIEAQYLNEVRRAADRFGDHTDMSQGRVFAWLEHFDDNHLALACKVLNQVRYFNGQNIRSMTRVLRDLVLDECGRTRNARVAFVDVGRPGSGSAVVARIMRSFRDGPPVKFLTMLEVATLDPNAFDALVFIDDFSATGDTLTVWWENVESIIRPLGIEILIGALVMTSQAVARLREFAADALPAEELGPESNVLEVEAGFTDKERAALLEYCRRTDCAEDYLRGYGGLGLLLAFKHGCPNNSLPILWCESADWTSLFHRRTV